MLKCKLCGKDIHKKNNGCTCEYYIFKPKETLSLALLRSYSPKEADEIIRSRTLILPRTKVGAVNDMITLEQYKISKRDRCHDCGALTGMYHHESCDTERCPRCGGQFLSCQCNDEYDIWGLDSYNGMGYDNKFHPIL